MESRPNNHQTVRVHIDRELYESPSPTTGEALYRLACVGDHLELFKEVDGNQEAQIVPRDHSQIKLKQDEHLYSQKDLVVIVNGRQKTITDRRLSYNEVVALAFDNPPTGPNILITVTYRNGPHEHPEGSLFPGESVKTKNGMIFNVRATDKS